MEELKDGGENDVELLESRSLFSLVLFSTRTPFQVSQVDLFKTKKVRQARMQHGIRLARSFFFVGKSMDKTHRINFSRYL